MNSQPSSAIENGLTSQLMPTVTAMPRQCCPTCPSAAKSIFSSIGTIISQTSTATGRLTCATSAAPMAVNGAGQQWPSDAGDDAQRHPERQIPLEHAERRRRVRATVWRCSWRAAPGHPVAGCIDDRLAVFLDESAALRAGQNFQHDSDGRHSRTPSGVTTIGRLIRTGCASIGRSAGRRSMSARRGRASHTACPCGAAGRARAMPMRRIRSTSSARAGGVFRYSMTRGSSPLLRIRPSTLRDVPQAGIVVDGDGHGDLSVAAGATAGRSVAPAWRRVRARSTPRRRACRGRSNSRSGSRAAHS